MCNFKIILPGLVLFGYKWGYDVLLGPHMSRDESFVVELVGNVERDELSVCWSERLCVWLVLCCDVDDEFVGINSGTLLAFIFMLLVNICRRLFKAGKVIATNEKFFQSNTESILFFLK